MCRNLWQKRKWEEYLFSLDSLLVTQYVKLFRFQCSKPILLLSHCERESNHGNCRLHGTGTVDTTPLFRRNAHRPTDQRPKRINLTPSILLERGTGPGSEPFDEPINLSLRPLVNELILVQSWCGGRERRDLFRSGLLDPLALLIRKRAETALNYLLVQDSDGKQADTTAGTTLGTWKTVEKGGVRAIEPPSGFVK